MLANIPETLENCKIGGYYLLVVMGAAFVFYWLLRLFCAILDKLHHGQFMQKHTFKIGDVVRIKTNFCHRHPFVPKMDFTIGLLGIIIDTANEFVAVLFLPQKQKYSLYYYNESSLEFIESIFHTRSLK